MNKMNPFSLGIDASLLEAAKKVKENSPLNPSASGPENDVSAGGKMNISDDKKHGKGCSCKACNECSMSAYPGYNKSIPEGVEFEEGDLLDEEAKRTSSSYLFTHTPGDEKSEAKLKLAKEYHKAFHPNKRVVLKGRLGKDNPNAHKYHSKTAWHGGKPIINIKKDDASRFDVYSYDKR
jgi:hypothetical protein